jgi:hypothetical protein
MIVFLDMDGVLADFDGALPPDQRRKNGVDRWDPPAMFEPGFFRGLPVMPGAKEAVSALMASPNIQLYIGSKPTTKALTCPTEKYQWIGEHFPDLLRRMCLVSDKSLLRGDFLVDDDKDRWAGVFVGTFIHFDREHPRHSWAGVVGDLIGFPKCPECGARHNEFNHTRLVDL